jgi:hypothetical protein
VTLSLGPGAQRRASPERTDHPQQVSAIFAKLHVADRRQDMLRAREGGLG